ncbi:L-fucose mutarotase [Rubritalea tangerina]|uniref:L-fucose mutarotase n=1 Tax=Rubritalea tangerina TaxID=430798 RepID=A0ABW4Z7P9_9BACT
MLKGLSPLLSPELLATLYRMGHGEEILFADAHYPVHQAGVPVIRADGHNIPELLQAVLPLLELDAYDPAPAMMMDVVPGDSPDPKVEAAYRSAIDQYQSNVPPIAKIERFAFYERAKSTHAIVATGDTAKYANLILKKGVTPT